MKTAIFNSGSIDFNHKFQHVEYAGSIESLEGANLSAYDVVIVNGHSDGAPYQLSYEMAHKLWCFAEQGGTVYGEMLNCDDFPSSRLFGFKQDFPYTNRRLEKLALRSGYHDDKANLLEWNGPFLTGFSIATEVMMDIDIFGETHVTEKQGKYPGMLITKHGNGKVIFSAFALFSSKEPWTLRPNWLWNEVIAKLNAMGLPCLPFEPAVTCLKKDIDEVLTMSIKWFESSGIMPKADGTAGIYENIHSVRGVISQDIRPDCNVHTALMFHLYGKYTQEDRYLDTSHHLLEYLFREGYQDEDPASPTYGFWKWFKVPYVKPEQIFSDDNGWVAFVLLYLYRQTGNEEYKRRGLLTAEALLRTQNANGLRCVQIYRNKFMEQELAAFVANEPVSMNPHFESIVHAAFIQAYLITGEQEYLDTAVKGSEYLLDHKDEMKFMYSQTSGYNRFVLALSHLYRLTGNEKIKNGLLYVVDYLKSNQHELGAIEEADNPNPDRYGSEDTGVFRYNGEGIADLLYTNNFLTINAWEAWKATGSEDVKDMYDKLIGFITSTQITSSRKEFNGGWFRAYHLEHQEYFGNNGDTGWGPYCMESGWTNAIITSGLLLNRLQLSLLD